MLGNFLNLCMIIHLDGRSEIVQQVVIVMGEQGLRMFAHTSTWLALEL